MACGTASIQMYNRWDSTLTAVVCKSDDFYPITAQYGPYATFVRNTKLCCPDSPPSRLPKPPQPRRTLEPH